MINLKKSKNYSTWTKIKTNIRHQGYQLVQLGTCLIESVQDFLIKLDIKPLMHLLERTTFSLNNVIDRLKNDYETQNFEIFDKVVHNFGKPEKVII